MSRGVSTLDARYKRKTEKTIKAIHKDLKRKDYPPLAVFNFDYVGRQVYLNGFYEAPELECIREYILPMLKDRDIFIDIGANIGNHTAFFSPYFKKVLSFEPNPRTAKLLEANAMLFSNVTVFSFGLSNEDCVATAVFDLKNMGGASVADNAKGEHKVEFNLKRLDDQISSAEKSKVALIKIDVEGHEHEALAGAVDILQKSAPVILFEANRSEITNGTTPAKEFLEEQGFSFFYTIGEVHENENGNGGLTKFVSQRLFRQKRNGHYAPVRIAGQLERKHYSIIIASKKNLNF